MYCVKILPAKYKINHLLLPQKFSISRTSVTPVDYRQHPSRKQCPTPQPAKQKRSWGWVKWMCGAAGAAATGGFVVFARNNEEVRDWLSIQAPWFDNVIALVYQENDTYSESMTKAVNYSYGCIQNCIKHWEQAKPEQPAVQELYSYFLDKDMEGKNLIRESEIVSDQDKLEVNPKCNEETPPNFINDLSEVERCCREYKNVIEDNYREIMTKNKEVADHIQNMTKIFNATNHEQFVKLVNEKDEFVFNAMEKIYEAKNNIETLSAYLNKWGKVRLSSDQYEMTQNVLNDLRGDMNSIERESDLQAQETALYEKQWRLINEANEALIKEKQMLFDDLDYSKNKPKLIGDPDLLLIHASRYIQMLEKHRDEALEAMKDKTDRVFLGDEKQLKKKLPKKLKEEEQNYKAVEDDLLKNIEENRKNAVESLKVNFMKSIPVTVAQHEEEMLNSIDDRVEDAKRNEREKFEPQIKELEKKLEQIEAALEERRKAEDEMKRCKRVHEAASCLIDAMMRGDCRVDVSEELQVLEEAGKDDDMVAKVVQSIPPEVRQKGIVPESNLWKGYKNMEQMALKVALVEEEGTKMPVYWLSYLQYILLSFRPESIPEAEAEKIPEKVPEHLDTFDILQRARYYASKREFAAAVHYVNALKGASRSAAHDWLEKAKEHVDTRIAAEAVMAHASSVCLRHV